MYFLSAESESARNDWISFLQTQRLKECEDFAIVRKGTPNIKTLYVYNLPLNRSLFQNIEQSDACASRNSGIGLQSKMSNINGSEMQGSKSSVYLSHTTMLTNASHNVSEVGQSMAMAMDNEEKIASCACVKRILYILQIYCLWIENRFEWKINEDEKEDESKNESPVYLNKGMYDFIHKFLNDGTFNIDGNTSSKTMDEYNNILLINDFYHILKIHEMQSISEYFSFDIGCCEVNECMFLRRHYRRRSNISTV